MIDQSPCPDRSDLERLVLGDMLDLEIEVLADHVSACPHCLNAIRAVQMEDPLVAAVRAGGKFRAVPSEQVNEALMARLCQMHPKALPIVLAPGAPPVEKVDELAGLMAPPEEPDELGRIGPYGILRVLGSGGMGIVFAARQARPRRVVALKMILAEPLAWRHQIQRFRGESEIIARLRHPNIVQVHEVGEHAGRAYFTMEHADGGNLAQKLAAAPLAHRAAAELIAILARAVHSAHEQGFVHRDLKPSNILLAADGAPRIGDFGLAKPLSTEAVPGETFAPGVHTETGVILGTPGYMAPEQAGPSQAVGPTADVYALGAILYECLTCRPPFKAATVLETLEQVRTQDPVPPGRLQPGLPGDLQTICLKCLEKEAGRRYPTAQALADDLSRFLRGESIHARPMSRREQVWKWMRRKPALSALLAVCGVLLAALVAGGLAHQTRLRAAGERLAAEKREVRRQQELLVDHYRAAQRAFSQLMPPPQGGMRLEDLARLQKRVEVQLAFYRAVEGKPPLDSVVRGDTAFAFAELGVMHIHLGQPRPAEENLRKAVALLEGMPPKERSQPTCQDHLAEAFTYLGSLVGGLGRHAEMERFYRQALAIRERLAEGDPDNPTWLSGLARAELLLGTVYQDSSRCTEAEAHFTRAQALHARLAHALPGDDAQRAQESTIWVHLGRLYQQTGRPDKALAALTRATTLLAPLAGAHPKKPHHVIFLASAYIDLAGFLLGTGQPEAARQRASQAVDLVETRVRHEPLFGANLALAREAHEKRARACAALGRWAEAVQDWDRALELEKPKTVSGRRARALALARAGEHARAGVEVQALEKDPELPTDGLFELACVCALSVKPARSDECLSAEAQQSQAEALASRAVGLLMKLRAQGYFKDAGCASRLKTSADLNSLRGRLDFQLLLLLVGKTGKKG